MENANRPKVLTEIIPIRFSEWELKDIDDEIADGDHTRSTFVRAAVREKIAHATRARKAGSKKRVAAHVKRTTNKEN